MENSDSTTFSIFEGISFFFVSAIFRIFGYSSLSSFFSFSSRESYVSLKVPVSLICFWFKNSIALFFISSFFDLSTSSKNFSIVGGYPSNDWDLETNSVNFLTKLSIDLSIIFPVFGLAFIVFINCSLFPIIFSGF